MARADDAAGAFGVLVSSCAAYAPTTLPQCVGGLLANGVAEEDVVVVVGQCVGGVVPDIPGVPPGVRVVGVPWTAVDATAIVWAAGSQNKREWVFCTQDTVMFGEAFGELARAAVAAFPAAAAAAADDDGVDGDGDDGGVDVVKLLDAFSMTIGFVRASWLAAARLDAMRSGDAPTLDDVRRAKTWIEDAPFGPPHVDPGRVRCLARYDPAAHVKGVWAYPAAPSADKRRAARRVEHYPVLDLYKLKSWYGQAAPEIPVGL